MIKLMENNLIYQVAVYKKPKDYPDGYIARRYNILPGRVEPTDECYADPDLAVVRAWIRENYPDLSKMGRSPGDDRCIHEVWI